MKTTKIKNFCRLRDSFRISKKAAIEISIRTIILLVIAIIVLMLLLSFIRGGLETATTKLEEQIMPYAPKPTVQIQLTPSSANNEYVTNQVITADGSYSYDLNNEITGYYWDTDGDGEIDEHGADKTNITLSYMDQGTYEITLKVLNNKGGLGEKTVTITIFNSNQKNMSKYNGTMFFAKELISQSNYDHILQLVPIVSWTDKEGNHDYPYVVYYENVQITETNITNILSQESKTKAVVVDDSGLSDSAIEYLDLDNPAEYFSYWSHYDTVVLAHETDESGVKAAIYASERNAPLIFTDEFDFVSNGNLLEGKFLHLVSSEASPFDSTVWDFINDQANNIPHFEYFTPDNLTTSHNLKSEIIID